MGAAVRTFIPPFLHIQTSSVPEHAIEPQSLDITESRAHDNFFAGIKYAYMPTHKERGDLTGVRFFLPQVDSYLITTFDADETENEAVEFYFTHGIAEWHERCTRPLNGGENLVFIIRKKKGVNNINIQAVIRREYADLTTEEISEHKDLVNQAKKDELQRWLDLDCFQRMPRSKATNRVDGTWILKWKKTNKQYKKRRNV